MCDESFFSHVLQQCLNNQNLRYALWHAYKPAWRLTLSSQSRTESIRSKQKTEVWNSLESPNQWPLKAKSFLDQHCFVLKFYELREKIWCVILIIIPDRPFLKPSGKYKTFTVPGFTSNRQAVYFPLAPLIVFDYWTIVILSPASKVDKLWIHQTTNPMQKVIDWFACQKISINHTTCRACTVFTPKVKLS